MTDPLNVTDFRFRPSNVHNRDMLEYQAEKAFMRGELGIAAQFTIAAALYSLVASVDDLPNALI